MPISRRHFTRTVPALAATAVTPLASAAFTEAAAQTAASSASAGSLTDVPGVRVGHATHADRPTGCTVILFDEPVTAGADYDGWTELAFEARRIVYPLTATDQELAGLEERVEGAGVEPHAFIYTGKDGVPSVDQHLDGIRDLVLAASARLQVRENVPNLRAEEVEARHREVGFRLRRLLN